MHISLNEVKARQTCIYVRYDDGVYTRAYGLGHAGRHFNIIVINSGAVTLPVFGTDGHTRTKSVSLAAHARRGS